ncbi:MAG: hypothetical protein UY39_C0044G0001, partial [Candidatus Kaiserbacteria bacterium GW2011_GWC2_49_12]
EDMGEDDIAMISFADFPMCRTHEAYDYTT